MVSQARLKEAAALLRMPRAGVRGDPLERVPSGHRVRRGQKPSKKE